MHHYPRNASLLAAQGNSQEAGGLLKRSLAIQEKVLGPDHQDIASSLSTLALMLRSQVAVVPYDVSNAARLVV